ncbi:MAG: hypothetical protein WA971_16245 [Microbacterium sp.]
MSPEPAAPAPRSISRRTALKAAAWSVPVVAAATAVPAYAAASGGAVIRVSNQQGFGPLVFSPDRLKLLTYSKVMQFDAQSVGPDAATPGWVVTLSYDNRELGDPTITIDGVEYAPATPTVNGTHSSSTFTIPLPVPVDSPLSATIAWGTDNELYFDDVADSTLFVKAIDADVDPGSYFWATSAQLWDTYDAQLTGTYVEHTSSNANGEWVWHTIDSLTVTALAPGLLSAENHAFIDITTPEYTTDIVVLSTALDGVAVSGFVTPAAKQDNGQYRIEILKDIPAGSALTIAVSTELSDSIPTDASPGPAYAYIAAGVADRDLDNNTTPSPFA